MPYKSIIDRSFIKNTAFSVAQAKKYWSELSKKVGLKVVQKMDADEFRSALKLNVKNPAKPQKVKKVKKGKSQKAEYNRLRGNIKDATEELEAVQISNEKFGIVPRKRITEIRRKAKETTSQLRGLKALKKQKGSEKKEIFERLRNEIFNNANYGNTIEFTFIDDKGERRTDYLTINESNIDIIKKMVEEKSFITIEEEYQPYSHSDWKLVQWLLKYTLIDYKILDNGLQRRNAKLKEIEDLTKQEKKKNPTIGKKKKIMLKGREKKNGKLFKYYHKFGNIDLSRYGILQKFDKEYHQHNCFYHALKNAGLSEEKLQQLTFAMDGEAFVMVTSIEEICNKLGIKILLTWHKGLKNGVLNTDTKPYGNSDEVYKICLTDNHYFVFDEDCGITQYSINNYLSVKDYPDFHLINKMTAKGNPRREPEKGINSLRLVELLLLNKETVLEEIDDNEEWMNTAYKNKQEVQTILVNKFEGLEYDEPMTVFEFDTMKSRLTNYETYFFDFESVTNEEYGESYIKYHNAFMVSWLGIKDNIISTLVEYDELEFNKIGLSFLERVTKNCKSNNIVLLAHNVSYDLQFLTKWLYSIRTNKTGQGTIITLSGFFKNRSLGKTFNITLKDTYTMIGMPIRDFPKAFGLANMRKEVIDYKIFNDNVKNYFIGEPIEKLNLKEVTKKYFNMKTKPKRENAKDKKDFEKNIKDLNLLDKDGNFEFMKYAQFYCEQDVTILKMGYLKLKEWFNDEFDLNIENFCTISSIADHYIKSKGCYDGVCKLSGVVRRFITKSIVGGKTMTRNNEKFCTDDIKNLIDNSGKIRERKDILKYLSSEDSCIDANGLYGSSMIRIDGFIKGQPIPFYEMNYDELNQKDFYFIEIKINDIGVKRSFPILNYISSNQNNEEVREFNDDKKFWCDGEKTLIVDKITLEDMIKYHEIKFDIIKGYYFNDGFNDEINNVIEELFQKRLEHKKNGNKVEMLYKLIINSCYGKSMQNEVTTKEKYFNNKLEGLAYMAKNPTLPCHGRQVFNDTKFVVTTKYNKSEEYENFSHIASYILSMSKRIMNEVFFLAEDNNIRIDYTDTDSIFIDSKGLFLLEQLYKKEYDRELIGKEPGQFKKEFTINDKHVTAKGSIYLAKKCYMNILSTDSEMELRLRMKGISAISISHTANKLYKHLIKEMNIINLYYDLLNGKEITFDLTCDGEILKTKKHGLCFSTKPEFNRKIKF